MSWELRPPVPTDKGTVVDRAGCRPRRGVLSSATTPATYRRSRRWPGSPGDGLETLAVAVGGPETPEELLAAADLVVTGPAGVLAFLSTLDAPAG